VAYTGAWKKFEPLWDWVIRAKRVSRMLPLLEAVLAGVGRLPRTRSTIHLTQHPPRVQSIRPLPDCAHDPGAPGQSH
jgi:hypothetical protein